jgi:hypothetical protein
MNALEMDAGADVVVGRAADHLVAVAGRLTADLDRVVGGARAAVARDHDRVRTPRSRAPPGFLVYVPIQRGREQSAP